MRILKLKLKTKLLIINTFTKVLIILIAIFIVPKLVRDISINNTDQELFDKLDQIYLLIEEQGIEIFVDTENNNQSYGSYNILKEEFISIEPSTDTVLFESIGNVVRIIEEQEIDYRVISANLQYGEDYYLIEIGKSIATIINFEKELKNYAFYFLLILLSISIVLDLVLTQILLRPFGKIIQKLKATQHPSSFEYAEVNTSTSDFIYLEESIHTLMKRIETAFNNEREYIGNISHELLTPISIIRSKLDNLTSESSLNDEDISKIFEIKSSLIRLTKMVRSLLLMSRIENEEYIKNEQVNIHEVLGGAIQEIKDRAEIKGIEVIVDFCKKEKQVTGNAELLHIMFFNILNNALKYTTKGFIKIESKCHTNSFKVYISDSGKGIAKEHLPHIFNRYKKFQDGESNFGLGLALAKKICEYHKTKITVESEIDKGSQFVISF